MYNQKFGISRNSSPLNKGRCWDNYEPVKGKEPYSPGSCQPILENLAMNLEKLLKVKVETLELLKKVQV